MAMPPNLFRHGPWLLLSLFAALALSACGGGGDGSSTGSNTLGGTVSGLSTDGLVLANGSDTLAVAAGATAFTFDETIGSRYDVTVQTQPSGQTCQVSHGSGSASGNVSSVTVTCDPCLAPEGCSAVRAARGKSARAGAATRTVAAARRASARRKRARKWISFWTRQRSPEWNASASSTDTAWAS